MTKQVNRYSKRESVYSLLERWEDCKGNEEAEGIVAYMLDYPSRDWLPLMYRAEAGRLRYGNVLLERSDEIYDNAAEILSDIGGPAVNDSTGPGEA